MNNITINRPVISKDTSNVLGSIDKIKRTKGIKIVDVESSTIFNNDSSFDKEYQLIMESIDNLNEDEIIDPMEKKVNYYTSDYWFSNGYTQIVNWVNYMYNYDSDNKEIIMKFWKDMKSWEIIYEEELSKDDKESLVIEFLK